MLRPPNLLGLLCDPRSHPGRLLAKEVSGLCPWEKRLAQLALAQGST